MTKFKVGDKVLVTVPETVTNTGIKRLNGRVLPISGVFNLGVGAPVYIIEGCTLLESHLERVESPAPDGACTKQEPQQGCNKLDIELVGLEKKELPDIDWEKRRWELASKLFSLTSHEQAISSADNFIEHYKQTLK